MRFKCLAKIESLTAIHKEIVEIFHIRTLVRLGAGRIVQCQPRHISFCPQVI